MKSKEMEYYDEEFERERRLFEFGICCIGDDSGASIMETHDDLALIRFYDCGSSSGECPVVYQIRRNDGTTVWRQDIAYLAEVIYDGNPNISVSNDQRKEAYEKWEEVIGSTSTPDNGGN